MAVTFLSESLWIFLWQKKKNNKILGVFILLSSQIYFPLNLTFPSFFRFHFDSESFVVARFQFFFILFFIFFVIFNIFDHCPVKDRILCLQTQWQKKSLQTWILKKTKSNMNPRKNWSNFSALEAKQLFFCLFEELRLENPCILSCWNAMFVSHNVSQ